MPRPKDTNKKSVGTSRASNRKGNASDVQKAISANSKKYNAMTSAQKKAYNVKQAKSVVKGVVTVASMVGGPGLVRKAGAKIVSKALARNLRNAPKGAPKVSVPKGGIVKKVYYKSRTTASKARERGGIYNDGEGSFLNNSKMVARGPRNAKDLEKMKNALINNVNSKNLKGKLGTTPANQPSRLIDRNIARHSVIRKKYPNSFKGF